MVPERLTSLDAAFLALSTPEVPFVPGCVIHLDRPLARSALADRVDALLTELPRYRQRIARTPLLGNLAWIDDDRFSLAEHVATLHVPAPGGDRELAALVAHQLTAGLPEGHPPWRLWTVEGLAGGRGALVAIVHHALVDGVAGIGLLERLLQLAPAAAPPAPAPRAREARRSLVVRAARRVAADLRGRAAAWHRLVTELQPHHHAVELAALLRLGMSPASDLGLDGRRLGGERSFATWTASLDDAKEIKDAFGVTVNDVMLACIAGALRRTAARRGIDPDVLDDARAMIPVNRHARGEHATSGNRVAMLIAGLAVHDADPLGRLQRIALTTRELKRRDVAGAGDMLVALSGLTWSGVLTNIFRVALWRRAFNVIITNVPGPPIPLYLLDARVTGIVPIVNLWPHVPLAIAIGSYAGTLTLAVNADHRVMPELAPFLDDLTASFAELRAAIRAAAAAGLSPP